jgi:hypothetical protein
MCYNDAAREAYCGVTRLTVEARITATGIIDERRLRHVELGHHDLAAKT